MNQIVSLFMFSCGDYEKVKQDAIDVHHGTVMMDTIFR